jgi:hypothetical protein
MLNEPDNLVLYVFAYGFVDHTVEILFKILFIVVFTWFYLVLLNFTQCYSVVIRFVWFNSVQLSFVGCSLL